MGLARGGSKVWQINAFEFDALRHAGGQSSGQDAIDVCHV